MPDLKISQLTDGSGLDPTDYFVVVRGGNNYKVPGLIRSGAAYDIRAYGASTSGDAAVGTNAAIDAAYAAGGGTVLVPPLGFVLASQVKLKHKVHLMGTGWGSVLTCNNSFPSSSMITLDSTSVGYTRISNLWLNGNKSNQSGAVAAVNYPGSNTNPNHYLDHCFVFNFKGRGLDIAATSGAVKVTDNWIYNNDAEGVYTASNDTHFVDNIVGASGLEGFLIAASNVMSTNNHSFGNGLVTASRGDGFKLTTYGALQSSNDQAADNMAHGWNLDTVYNCVISGANSGDNNHAGTTGAAIRINGGGSHNIRLHASGGFRNVQASVLLAAGTISQSWMDLTYDSNSIGANPAVSGSVTSGNFLRINGVRYGAAAYTTSNVATNRTLDANTISAADLADVVGTLIADLKLNGSIT